LVEMTGFEKFQQKILMIKVNLMIG
jgi:hypothetical protein